MSRSVPVHRPSVFHWRKDLDTPNVWRAASVAPRVLREAVRHAAVSVVPGPCRGEIRSNVTPPRSRRNGPRPRPVNAHVFREAKGLAHEWQTWRYALHDFAPRLFQQTDAKSKSVP